MLNDFHLLLLDFLKEYQAADQETCLRMLDYDRTSNWNFLRYSLRPLVRYGYITRRSDKLYSLTEKGRKCTSRLTIPKVTCGGDRRSRNRAAQIADVAALFHRLMCLSFTDPLVATPQFIPSPIWRKTRSGIVSTSMFCGILIYRHMRLAVYNIGNGDVKWQTYAERSLHFRTYGNHETRVTGVLLICNDGEGIRIGKDIIRQTLSRHKRLLKDPSETSWENPKKRPVSSAPIQLHSDYQQVYLAEKSELAEVLETAATQEKQIADYCKNTGFCENRDWRGRFLEKGNDRVYYNLQNDLLYLATIIKKLKDHRGEFQHVYIAGSKYYELAVPHEKHGLLILTPKQEVLT